MGLGKRVARSRLGRAALVWLYARFASLVFATTRWRIHGRDDAEALIRAGQPFICAFWHGRLMLAPHGWPKGTPIHVMISRHRDGENIVRATRHLGVVPIRGSRTRGGVAAGRASLRVLKEGGYVAISPDGPRGPRMRVQPGIIALARLSGAPIVPITFGVSRRAVANSWDRFVIALPFGRGVYLWGPPLHVAADADEAARERARIILEERLNALTAEADRMVGAEPIEPAGEVARTCERRAGAAPAAARQ